MHRREFLLSATGIVGASTVGSIAYTSASVDRSVTANVAADSGAVIELSSGGIGAVSKTNGKLTIDTSSSNADGLNADATFTYGDASESTYAFSIKNNDTSSHDLTIDLSGVSTPSSGSSFSIDLYDSTDTSIGSVSSGGSMTYSNWSSTEIVNAVISIDTTGTTSADSISGTMTLSI